jgi:hypothetical protein
MQRLAKLLKFCRKEKNVVKQNIEIQVQQQN